MLTLFHDYTSPASAVAVRRMHRLADEGLEVEFVGFEAVGVDMFLPVTVDVLAELDDLADIAAAEGVILHRPSGIPATGLAHVAGEEAELQGLGRPWREACYAAFWEDGADLSSRQVLVDIAATAGVDPSGVGSAFDDRLRLAAVRRRMTGHRRNGVGGVPTLLAHRTLVPGLLSDDDLRSLSAL